MVTFKKSFAKACPAMKGWRGYMLDDYRLEGSTLFVLVQWLHGSQITCWEPVNVLERVEG